MMIFDLDEDSYDENNIEEIKLVLTTKTSWSFQHPIPLTASISPIDNPVQPIMLISKDKRFSL